MTRGWDAAERVLCVRLDALGDVLMTTPAIRALKESGKNRRITLVTSPSGAGIAALVPEVDEIVEYRAPWMKATPPSPDSRADHEMVERLRSGHYDAAVVFTVYSQNPLPAALMCFLADIPRRLAHCRENPYHVLTDWIPDPEPAATVRHEVRRQLDLVEAVGCRTCNERLSLRVDAGAAERVLLLLAQEGVDPASRFVVVHPGATAPSRRYPPDQFAEAARLLALEFDCPIVLTGSGDESGIVDEMRHEMGVPSLSLAGRLTLGELAALIDLAPLLVSNNSGPVHLASALGTPVVDLYALTNPQHTPWMVPSRVLFYDVPCRYCYKSVCPEGHQDCLRRVEPGAVLQAARELLEGRRVAEALRLPPLVSKRPSLPAPIEAGGGLA